MKWTEIKIVTTEEAYDAICDMLGSIGAGGVSIMDPFDIRQEIEKPNTLDYADDEFIDSLGEDVIIKAYFNESHSKTELAELIKEKLSFIGQFLDIGKGFEGFEEVDDEDWSTSWKKYYKPIEIAENIIIKPSWEEYTQSDDEIVIELDPGMAFGTGTHETTSMCARYLNKYMSEMDSVLDVGCGSGILSIIAAKLGAKSVTAVDIDSVAVRVANENSVLNGTDNVVTISAGIIQDLGESKNDLIVANIIASVIVDIAKEVKLRLKEDGLFITSGIIKERKEEVIEAYTSIGFKHIDTEELGEWVAMVFKCQGSL
jgi:ribosomal protein L11 methyltransferase